ncbi:unnamed protein product [Tenebrio molitor]|nr:unnamed protein product [Tenebrio molitor]
MGLLNLLTDFQVVESFQLNLLIIFTTVFQNDCRIVLLQNIV